jgi:hypothetical protein
MTNMHIALCIDQDIAKGPMVWEVMAWSHPKKENQPTSNILIM